MSATFDPYESWLGIEDSERPVNAYRLLGLELYDSDPQRIQLAAQRCVQTIRLHAKGPHASEAQALTVEVTSAKLLLLNPDQKGPYDVMLRKRALERQRKLRTRILAITGAGLGVVLIGITIAIVYTLFSSPKGAGTMADASTMAAAESESTTDQQNVLTHVEDKDQSDSVSQPQTAESPTPTAQDPISESPGLPDVIGQLEPAVVRIEVKRKGVESIGSGFLADSLGTIITSFHVVDQADSITVVCHDGTRYPARGFVAADPSRDLAAIRVLGTIRAKPLELANGLPKKGETVLAMGSPQGFSSSAAEGIVSGIRTGKEIARALNDLRGADAYHERGLALEAVWVQSTAAISGGNSGGPLLNTEGELVAVNSWTHGQGQSLNFAISVDDVRILLSKAGSEPQPFAKLPSPSTRQNSGPTQSNAQRVSKDFRVELPSGKAFTHASTVLPESQIRQAFPEKVPKLTITDPNGNVSGVFTHQNGRLHGAAATFHPNGQCWVFAMYKDSKREGLFRAWDESGKRIVWAEFRFDRKDGAACLFRDDAPWLIQEYEKGNLISSHLVTYDADQSQLVTFTDTDKAINEDQQLSEAIQEFSRLAARGTKAILAGGGLRGVGAELELGCLA